jgi:hypothetical protein
MKKLFAILTLATLTGTAFAGGGVSFEFEREQGVNAPNTFTNTIKVAPYYKFDNGIKADVQFGASRDDGAVAGNNNPIDNSIEVRVQKMWAVAPKLELGLRIGVGEKFNGINGTTGKTSDWTYYTVEPKAEYAITDKLSALASYRWRDALTDKPEYQSKTWKVGMGYALTKQDEVEVKYFQKRGDEQTNGMLVEYTRKF